MPFRGLTMLKSPKLTIKGGLCYGFAMVSSGVITHQADVPGLLKAVEDEDEDLQQAHGQHEQRRRQARVLVLNIYTFNCSEVRGHANLVGVFVGDKKFHSLL